MVLGKLDSQRQKNETGCLSYTVKRINSKRMKDLNARLEILKLLEGNTMGKPLDIDGFSPLSVSDVNILQPTV